MYNFHSVPNIRHNKIVTVILWNFLLNFVMAYQKAMLEGMNGMDGISDQGSFIGDGEVGSDVSYLKLD